MMLDADPQRVAAWRDPDSAWWVSCVVPINILLRQQGGWRSFHIDTEENVLPYFVLRHFEQHLCCPDLAALEHGGGLG